MIINGFTEVRGGIPGRAADLLFPRRCPRCDRPVRPAGALICPECAQGFVRVGGPVCMKCGKPVPEGEALCGDCAGKEHSYDRGCAVFLYHSISASIYRFKYGGRREYADYYGREMVRRLREVLAEPGARAFPRPQVLVPVPVSRSRYRKRGYNQAALLARKLSAISGIPVREDILRRVSETAAMRMMSAAERQNNLKKAFIAYGNSVNLKSIMLVDDIYTTGATADACAAALRDAGAETVSFMTLAIGEDSGCLTRTESGR